MVLPDQLAPLLGSIAISGGAKAEARVGVDVCSDDSLPASLRASVSGPVTLMSCPNLSSSSSALGLDTQDQPPMLSVPHEQAE